MRHSWVFEVLSDLRDYALANGLPRLASKAAEAEAAARDDLAERSAIEEEGNEA